MNILRKLILASALITQFFTYGAAKPAAAISAPGYNDADTQKMFDAIKIWDVEALDTILKTGRADVNAKSNHLIPTTVLGKVIQAPEISSKDKVAMVTLLLSYGANPAIAYQQGGIDLPLHLVASNCIEGSAALVKVFLAFNEKLVDARGTCKCTPLMEAVWSTYLEADEKAIDNAVVIIKILLSYEADITLINKSCKNALELARVTENRQVIEVLDTHNKGLKKKIIVKMQNAPSLMYFPPGLIPLIVDYVQ